MAATRKSASKSAPTPDAPETPAETPPVETQAKETVPPVVDVTDAKPLDVKQLERDLVAALKTAIGKLDATEKQAYTRYNHGGSLVAYVRSSKKGLLVQLEARVDDPADIGPAVEAISTAFSLSK